MREVSVYHCKDTNGSEWTFVVEGTFADHIFLEHALKESGLVAGECVFKSPFDPDTAHEDNLVRVRQLKPLHRENRREHR